MYLIDTALDYIKFYDTTKFEIGGIENLRTHSQFRRTVAVKCEFKRFPAEFRHDSERNLDVDNWNGVDDRELEGETERLSNKKAKKGRRRPENIYVEKDRELVSLLTISGTFKFSQ